ncbi:MULTISPECIES: undecaprenyl-diphosphate phosphatase [Candidatus Ichthyocystis]|uniref:undecaprenyl-diphosphate phosphatase n=1 Tax=Candidatus Ichthyocystis TaxID=2929841 RepID=UPI000AC24594|nr:MULTISPECIES: undecaprenyl-diphosphate phosphatase [Ichthyocystis]
MLSAVFILKACLLGVVQGITEFLPVSSSAHVVLLSSLLGGIGPHSKAMLIFLQGVSVLAVVRLYRPALWQVIVNYNTTGRSFIIGVALGTLPFVAIGGISHGFVVRNLFSPMVVSINLIIGGFVLIVANYFCRIDKYNNISSLDEIKPLTSLMVGLIQVLAVLPGVSRSGSTIIGGMLCGMSRPLAVKYSFILAIPLLTAVSIFQMSSVINLLTMDEWVILLISSLVTFFISCAVVRILVDFLGHGSNSLLLIGGYRVFLGIAILIL